jgi:catechol 2,3-dioxygenase-like lactoylglutathione lyase family enzyme
MVQGISTGPVHHLRLTVTDVERSRAFYSEVLGFETVMELDPGFFLSNGAVGLGMCPAPVQASAGDRFDENRVGLDHLSFSMVDRQQLEAAVQSLDEHGVPHGEIKDLGEAFQMFILAFREPDNIQLELSAPYS